MLNQKRQPVQVLAFPFYIDGDKVEYCLLQRKDNNVWQGVAGGADGIETPKEAAIREMYEESGIKNGKIIELESVATMPSIDVNKRFIEDNILIVKEIAYGIEVESKTIIISNEHSKYEWLSYEDAYDKLTWDSNKTALWELDYRIKNGMII